MFASNLGKRPPYCEEERRTSTTTAATRRFSNQDKRVLIEYGKPPTLLVSHSSSSVTCSVRETPDSTSLLQQFYEKPGNPRPRETGKRPALAQLCAERENLTALALGKFCNCRSSNLIYTFCNFDFGCLLNKKGKVPLLSTKSFVNNFVKQSTVVVFPVKRKFWPPKE